MPLGGPQGVDNIDQTRGYTYTRFEFARKKKLSPVNLCPCNYFAEIRVARTPIYIFVMYLYV